MPSRKLALEERDRAMVERDTAKWEYNKTLDEFLDNDFWTVYRNLRIMDIALFHTQTDVTTWTAAKLGLDDAIISRVSSWLPGDRMVRLT